MNENVFVIYFRLNLRQLAAAVYCRQNIRCIFMSLGGRCRTDDCIIREQFLRLLNLLFWFPKLNEVIPQKKRIRNTVGRRLCVLVLGHRKQDHSMALNTSCVFVYWVKSLLHPCDWWLMSDEMLFTGQHGEVSWCSGWSNKMKSHKKRECTKYKWVDVMCMLWPLPYKAYHELTVTGRDQKNELINFQDSGNHLRKYRYAVKTSAGWHTDLR